MTFAFGIDYFARAQKAEAEGQRRLAALAYYSAWCSDSKNIDAGIAYARTIFDDQPRSTAETMDEMLENSESDSEKLKILGALLFYKEFSARIDRELMPYHATSLDEMFFKYCVDDFELYQELAFKSNDLVAKCLARFCDRDRSGAQRNLTLFRDRVQNHVWSCVNFDPKFYAYLESMSDEDILRGLPEVHGTGLASSSPTIYLGADGKYMNAFGDALVASLRDVSNGQNIHIHEMNPLGNKLGVGTYEYCEASRAYYHSIRFIRLWQHLREAKGPLWLMDVDALFRNDPAPMFATLDGHDVAFRVRAGRFEPWNQFNACVVGVAPTPAAQRYFRLIAAYIAFCWQRGNLQWGIDQFAMYGCYEYLRDLGCSPKLAFLDDKHIDYEYKDNGIVWCNSGKNKFMGLKPGPDGKRQIDPDRVKYMELYERYAK